MKSIFVLVTLSLMSFSSFSQETVKETLAKGKVVSWTIERVVQNQKDTMVFFYWGYQNKKYSQIRDIGSIFIYSKEDLKLFAEKLSEFANSESGKSISYSFGKFSISVYDFSNQVFIENNKGKYTSISKKNAVILSNEILQNVEHLVE